MDARKVHSLAEVLDTYGPIILRDQDVSECKAGGFEPEEALRLSIEQSDESFVVLVDSAPICLWGYRRGSQCIADVWLLTTPRVDGIPIAFVKETHRLMDVLLKEFNRLQADVWLGYDQAIRWLRLLGFSPEPTAPMENFIRMTRGGTDDGRS